MSVFVGVGRRLGRGRAVGAEDALSLSRAEDIFTRKLFVAARASSNVRASAALEGVSLERRRRAASKSGAPYPSTSGTYGVRASHGFFGRGGKPSMKTRQSSNTPTMFNSPVVVKNRRDMFRTRNNRSTAFFRFASRVASVLGDRNTPRTGAPSIFSTKSHSDTPSANAVSKSPRACLDDTTPPTRRTHRIRLFFNSLVSSSEYGSAPSGGAFRRTRASVVSFSLASDSRDTDDDERAADDDDVRAPLSRASRVAAAPASSTSSPRPIVPFDVPRAVARCTARAGVANADDAASVSSALGRVMMRAPRARARRAPRALAPSRSTPRTRPRQSSDARARPGR